MGRRVCFQCRGAPPLAWQNCIRGELGMAGTVGPRRTFRYWLQQLHLWIGLILLLPLVMMGVTGAVLVYGHEIEHLLGQGEPAAKTVGEWRSPAELVEAARTA